MRGPGVKTGDAFGPSFVDGIENNIVTVKPDTQPTGLTFLVESNKGLGDGLTNGVDLADVAAALHADADVHVAEALLAEQQDRLRHLEPHDLRLNEVQRRPCARQPTSQSALLPSIGEAAVSSSAHEAIQMQVASD